MSPTEPTHEDLDGRRRLNLIFSEERLRYLRMPSGELITISHLNGLHVFGFCFVFLGIVSILLGLLDAIIIPTFYTSKHDHFPLLCDLGNAFWLPIIMGLLVVATGMMALRTVLSHRFTSLRKFYLALLVQTFLITVYWSCLIAAIVQGYFSLAELSDKMAVALVVTRVFTAINITLTIVPTLCGLILYRAPFLRIYSNIFCIPFRWTVPYVPYD